MTLPPNLPQRPEQREVTPEERHRATRMFWLILLLFPTLVGTMVAYLSVKGRQVRDYGHMVFVEANKQSWTASGLDIQPCTRFFQAPRPAEATGCEVQIQDGSVQVVLKMQNGQEYRVNK